VRFARRRANSHRLAVLVPLLAAVALLAAAARPNSVAAHARLRSSAPAVGSTLGTAPQAVALTFSETPDVGLTSVKVLDSGGSNHAEGPAVAVPEPPGTVQVPLGPLNDGVYTVSWRTVSAVDGHISAGSFVFGVGQAPPSSSPNAPVAGSSESGSPPAIAARWVLYLGLMALFGAAWVALAVARGPARDLLAMAAIGWLLTVSGTIAVVAVQWAEIGAPLESLPSSSIGVAALARLVSLGLVALALAGLAALPAFGGQRGWALVAGTAALAVVVDVGTGHAAAGADWILQIVAQAAHAVAGAAWVGGLAALLVVLRTTPPDDRLATARRFSSWAGVALAIVIVTGAARAFAEIGTLDALVGTDFGRVVIAKSGLLLGLATLGAFNRFFTLKSAARVARHFRRVGGAEVAVAIAIIGLSALLVNLSPPASAAGPTTAAAPPIVATGHDFGTSVRTRLVASPGAVGVNTFDLALTDYDTRAPVDASSVKLRFELTSQSGVAPSTLDLARSAAGRFTGSGSNLSIDGIWRLTATVTVGASAVEVPMIAVTMIPAQPVASLVSAGLPTIYTVQLGAAGSAQVYLDPGRAGPNELHVTFFDPAGIELPINSATIAAFPGDGSGASLAPRLLEPGHFVAAIEAIAGSLGVDAVAPLPASAGVGHVHLHVTIEVTP
jgi:copper transport protein